MTKKDPNKYPKGWNEARVRKVIEYYDHQTDEEAAKEIETAPAVAGTVWVEVPHDLLPAVRKLLSRRKPA